MTQDAFRTHDGRTLEQAASDLVQREVLCCMSSMVATLAAGSGSYTARAGELQSLAEQAAELATPALDYEGAAREAGWRIEPTKLSPGFNASRPSDPAAESITTQTYASAEAAAQAACGFDDIEPHELEVYEHWAVSTWFAEKLQAAGERVDTDFAGLNVWARTTTGQAIHADAVVERITREMHAA